MGYINFKEEVCVANIQLEKRRKNNINANELLLKNKNTLPNYKPCEKYSFKVNEDLFVGKEGLLREEEFYELKNKDRVSIITDDMSFGPRIEWVELAKTTYAKRKIKEFNNK